MTTYTVTYSEAEEMAMQYVAKSADEWIQNAAHERARIAIDEIIQKCVPMFLEANIQIPGSREEIVAAAYEHGFIKTAVQREIEFLANLQANTP